MGRGTRVMGSIGLGGLSAVKGYVVAEEATAIDEVDVQSEQSFPASDPPSWSGASISRSRRVPPPGLERYGADQIAVR
jgi:hypothetical protein